MTKSKLKRRLRKKNHFGEFQEFGFEIFIKFESSLINSSFHEFLDNFIDLVEENKLLFGGSSGQSQSFEGFITSAKKNVSPTKEEREIIKNWLGNRSEVIEVKIGEFSDAWN